MISWDPVLLSSSDQISTVVLSGNLLYVKYHASGVACFNLIDRASNTVLVTHSLSNFYPRPMQVQVLPIKVRKGSVICHAFLFFMLARKENHEMLGDRETQFTLVTYDARSRNFRFDKYSLDRHIYQIYPLGINRYLMQDMQSNELIEAKVVFSQNERVKFKVVKVYDPAIQINNQGLRLSRNKVLLKPQGVLLDLKKLTVGSIKLVIMQNTSSGDESLDNSMYPHRSQAAQFAIYDIQSLTLIPRFHVQKMPLLYHKKYPKSTLNLANSTYNTQNNKNM